MDQGNNSDEQPEKMVGRVFEANGSWHTQHGPEPNNLMTSPPLPSKQEAEAWLASALQETKLQFGGRPVILERLDGQT